MNAQVSRITMMVTLLWVGTSLWGQVLNEYTVGVDSKGNYGMSLNRGNENSLFQISYSNLNMNNTFRLKNLPAEQNIFSSQVNAIGLAYFRKKNLTSALNLYYGTSVQWGNSPFKSALLENKNLSNINLQVGIKYKLSENISVGAEIHHSYGNYWMNNFIPLWQNSPANSSWLSW